MFCCGLSKSPVQKYKTKRSKEIDGKLNRDKNASHKTCKLLFLGSGESGKSTFFRQMRICHGKGYPEEELRNFTPIVYSNTVQCMRTLVEQSQRLPGCHYDSSLQQEADFILSLDIGSEINEDVASAVAALWKDRGIQHAWEQRSKFQIFDSASYFFDNVQSFEHDDYVPSVDDMLRCRVRTSGIVEETFMIEEAKFHVVDVGGQRNERKKWIHCFENVTAVAFVASISEFDQLCIEDGITNRLDESLTVFADLVNNNWFKETAIILFLNKKDLLVEKLQRVRFADHHPDYQGDNSYQSVKEHLKNMFLAKAVDHHVYTHFTCATDETPQLQKLFLSVKNIVVETSLKEGGFF